MKTWKLSPKALEVAKYVDCYWFLERLEGNGCYQYPKLNPDPAGHLIITAAEQAYHYEKDGVSIVGKGSHWLFPHCQTFKMDHSQSFLLLGVKFHIGALYSLDITPAQPILDQVIGIDINVLFESGLFSETDILMYARLQSEKCCGVMDELLKPWLSHRHQDKHAQLLHNALPILLNTPISSMGEQLHCSQRTLERSFLRVTGLTLKQCQSMNRLEAMLEHLYHLETKDIDWVDIAYIFGFSDQPHLIRYLKSNIGSTPGEYAKQRDLTIDIYGDFENH